MSGREDEAAQPTGAGAVAEPRGRDGGTVASAWAPGGAAREARDRRLNLSAGAASLAVAVALIIAKSWAWAATGSLAVAASLIDSAIDLVVSGANLAALIYAAKPPDEDHRFGHSSIEDLAALAQSVIVAGAAVLLGWTGIVRLLEPRPLAAETEGIAVMALSVVLSGALIWWQRRVARETGSRVVAADSLHYLSDFLPALGSIVSLALSAAFGIVVVDSLVALLAAAWLLRGAWAIGGAAIGALMDRAAPPEVEARIASIIAEFPEIRGFHDLRTRVSGPRIFIQVHIELDGTLTLLEAHDVAARLKRRLLEEIPRADVIVHKDPRPASG